ncbi:MAG: hypothetical protein ABI925_10695, partial [Verrucomicrobiota bacterium]
MRPFLASFYRLFLALGFTGISLSAPCLPAVDAVEADSPPVEVRADPPQYDWAKLHASARVIQVSSGAKAFAFRMIDNDERTAFHFSKADLHPTVIVELAQGEDLTRVKALFDAEAAQVDVYLSNQLPKDAGDFGFLRPVASV